MFTGLIEHRAQLHSRIPLDEADSNGYARGGFTLTFHLAGPILGDCSVGDSIAVNGACLTVLTFDPQGSATEQTQQPDVQPQAQAQTGPRGGWFKVGLAPETLNRTNLGELREGDWVNCERAMSAHTRFGGHFVQGHVDTTATITSKTPEGNSIRYTFSLNESPVLPSPFELARSLIPKGYITLDGTSLTLTESSVVDGPASGSPTVPTSTSTSTSTSTPAQTQTQTQTQTGKVSFGIMLIAHSQSKVTLADKAVGETVNVEVDSVGKFIGVAVDGVLSGSAGPAGKKLEGLIESVVERVLREKGLI